ncbi:MAG: Gfo/Idh/MocA family oxidoreductase, partial [Verrucomicrobiota bacterium]|nr:Gfo/Idh/MocA family oxidoreductase [Verrucomicrobiota bacterium]
MKNVRLGIVGLGVIGQKHTIDVLAGKVARLKLTAVVSRDPAKRARYPGVAGFSTLREMIAANAADAVLIATPHYDHAPSGITALKAGLHVLVEKPIAAHKADALRLLAAHKNKKQVFAAMFNQRTDPHYQKIRRLVRAGQLGRLQRVSWIVTDWFRTEAYYASSRWRATWAGEGGGVLINQCLHNLDLIQWIFGLPQRVQAHCGFGKYHGIEVEDDVTAYMEFAGGATATLITSTGEAPGANRLEIAGELGRVVYENGKIDWLRNKVSAAKFSHASKELFAKPPAREVAIHARGQGGQHIEIMKNFADAILSGKSLIAPAAE